MKKAKVNRSPLQLINSQETGLGSGVENTPRAKVICIEGNIGSGKTSLIQRIKKEYSSVESLEEPVNKWRDIAGDNLLDLMYTDPKRWSYTLQNYVLLTMMENHQKESDKNILIIERSVYSALYCFVENLHKSGCFSNIEYNVHHDWFKWMKRVVKPQVDAFIYLQTSPSVCLQRIQERGRYEEKKIDVSFLQSVHDRHEEWLIKQEFDVPAPVLMVDGNQSTDDIQLDDIFQHFHL